MIAAPRFELMLNVNPTATTILDTKILNEHVQQLRPGESGFTEFPFDTLFPLEEQPAPLSLSLIKGTDWRHVCDMPVYALWHRTEAPFEKIACDILERGEIAGAVLGEIIGMDAGASKENSVSFSRGINFVDLVRELRPAAAGPAILAAFRLRPRKG